MIMSCLNGVKSCMALALMNLRQDLKAGEASTPQTRLSFSRLADQMKRRTKRCIENTKGYRLRARLWIQRDRGFPSYERAGRDD